MRHQPARSSRTLGQSQDAPNPAKTRGFTLVELMITVAVIGITGLLAAPALLSYVSVYRVNGATKALASQMNLIRMKAIARNFVYHAAFDAGTQTLKIYRDEDNDWATANVLEQTLNIGTDFANVKLGYNASDGPDGVAIAAAAVFGATANPVRAVFLPNGLMLDSGIFYLIPSMDAGTTKNTRMRAVQVSRTGQVLQYRYKTGATPPWEQY